MADDKAPPFSYSKIIKSPANFNAGPGSGQFGQNMRALNSYTDLLLTSDTEANCLRPSPLGDQFFLKTSATCKDPNSGEKVSRYIYVSHQPEHSSNNDPLNSSSADGGSYRFDGLIPGIINNMFNLNIFGIFSAFSQDDNPDCVLVELSSTRDLPGNICSSSTNYNTYNTRFISKNDAEKVDPCSFRNGQNPYNKKYCQYNVEGLENMASIPNDSLVYLYYTLFGAVGIYVLFCFVKKHKRKR